MASDSLQALVGHAIASAARWREVIDRTEQEPPETARLLSDAITRALATRVRWRRIRGVHAAYATVDLDRTILRASFALWGRADAFAHLAATRALEGFRSRVGREERLQRDIDRFGASAFERDEDHAKP